MATASFANAPCVTDDPFLFQSMIDHGGKRKADACKALCAKCDAHEACLPLGEFQGEVLAGVYAGMTQRERQALKDKEGGK